MSPISERDTQYEKTQSQNSSAKHTQEETKKLAESKKETKVIEDEDEEYPDDFEEVNFCLSFKVRIVRERL